MASSTRFKPTTSSKKIASSNASRSAPKTTATAKPYDPRGTGGVPTTAATPGIVSVAGTDPRNIGMMSSASSPSGVQAAAATGATNNSSIGATGFPRNTGTDKTNTPFGDSIAANQLGTAWADPQALLTQYFKFKGLSQLGGGYAQALDDSQRAGLLYMLLNNNTPGGLEQYGNAGPVDWFGRYQEQGARPGQAGVGAQDIARGVFDAREGTPVYDALYNTPQTPQEQIDNWINTMSSGLQGTMPAPIYQAYVARLQQAGRDFSAQRLSNPNGPTSFGEYINQQHLGRERFGLG